jgi:diguanylate cyclase (GGDEF)-like protein
VAFMDIDNFKSFNTEYRETKVDRNILPRFMQLLEAHFKFHGHAYRQGGDEYLAIIPGLSPRFAIDFLEDLRLKVSRLEYPDVARNLTVSIGVCTADLDCPLTNRELQEMANRAKEKAKGSEEEKKWGTGRNRIAAYQGNTFRDEDIKIVSPK